MKNIETLKISEVISILQQQVKDLKIKGTHSDFHDKLKSIIKPLLQDYNSGQLRIYYWEINMSGKRHPILKYSVDFMMDMRSGESRPKGTFTNVAFSPVNADTDTSKTFAEYFSEEDIEILNKNIQNNANFILSLQNQLKEAQAQQDSMQQELLFKLS